MARKCLPPRPRGRRFCRTAGAESAVALPRVFFGRGSAPKIASSAPSKDCAGTLAGFFARPPPGFIGLLCIYFQNRARRCRQAVIIYYEVTIYWCGQEGLNLHDVTHTALNRARLPIPPCPRVPPARRRRKCQMSKSKFQINVKRIKCQKIRIFLFVI